MQIRLFRQIGAAASCATLWIVLGIVPAALPLYAAAQGAQNSQNADYIVAVVNAEPITNRQVSIEVERYRRQLVSQRQNVPDARTLTRQVLDQLINERALLQQAKELGIKVDEPSIDQAEQTVASQNQMTVAALRAQLQREGVTAQVFRDRLRDQIMLTRLREREVESRVRISDAEVEQYLAEQLGKNDPASQLVNIAHILVAVPENADAQQQQALKVRAEQILRRAKGQEDFAALARELSDSRDRTNGGQLGLRPADRYPALFWDAVRNLQTGDITGPVRSGAGWHVLKVMERRHSGLPPQTVTQSRARHILLVPSSQMNEAQAREKLLDIRRRIVSGGEDFAALARENSQDGSAAQGGDLGWANPGMFVPEFERVMDSLQPGEISQPLISRFGVHLIQLMERRQATLGEIEQREMVRNMLRQRKVTETYENWVRDVRARAWVELREAPQ